MCPRTDALGSTSTCPCVFGLLTAPCLFERCFDTSFIRLMRHWLRGVPEMGQSEPRVEARAQCRERSPGARSAVHVPPSAKSQRRSALLFPFKTSCLESPHRPRLRGASPRERIRPERMRLAQRRYRDLSASICHCAGLSEAIGVAASVRTRASGALWQLLCDRPATLCCLRLALLRRGSGPPSGSDPLRRGLRGLCRLRLRPRTA